jgi:hypothetical protein
MKLPSFLPPHGVFMAAVALFVVAGIILADGNRMFSPGPLSAANDTGAILGGVSSHAALEADCAACHTAPWSSQSMTQRCVDCHTGVQAELADPSQLHGRLAAANCRDCHTEHGGAQAPLTRVKRLLVDHEQFNFSLAVHQTTAAGQPFACADCHTESLARFDPATCETCHQTDEPDFTALHVADYGNGCQACHDGTDRFSEGQFDHNRQSYPPLGKHASVACTDCHTGVRDLEGFTQAPTDCVSCHLEDNQHPVRFGNDCAQCHNSEAWDTEIFDHDLATYKLTGKHLEVACAGCHLNDVYQGTPQTCIGCHAKDDVHLAQYGSDCTACHTAETWQRGPFEHTFPLDHGGGGIIACTTCHTEQDNYTAYTCYNCHTPADIERVHAFSRFMGTDITNCVRCHPTGRSTMLMH